MSAHIPDQLEQLSKKELVEFAKTAHGYSVELNAQLAKASERIVELEKENKRESMELRSRLGSALGRNSEYNSAIENMQQKLAKANERVKELESYNVKLANESREYQQRVHKLERSLEERTQYINTLADSVQKDINRVWILDGFVEQVSKVDCESFTEVFLIKDTASRLLRKEQE